MSTTAFNRFICLTLLWFILLIPLSYGQEVPQIQSFDRSSESFDRQCWSIAEDCDGNLYTATAAGINVFNGFQWTTVPLPFNRIARCLYRGNDCNIYVGGFETFGYVALTDYGEPIYHPLGDSLLKGTNEEIWQIIGNASKIMFQSFSMLFKYDYSNIVQVPVPRNIRLGESIGGDFYFPDIHGSVLVADSDSVTEIYSRPSGVPLRISALSSTEANNELLIATERNGLFKMNIGTHDENTLEPIGAEELADLATKQINDILPLKSGGYAIGTVLDGVYITTGLNAVDFHINKQNGLSSNTVISFHEDTFGNLWVGTDGGVNVVRLSTPTMCFYDNTGYLGTVYSSETYNGEVLMATNHGVFRQKSGEVFKLVPNTQGQSWQLFKFDDVLLCGHNNGTYLFDGTSAKLVSDVTGGWWMHRINDSTVLQSTYTGLIRLTRTGNNWRSDRVRKGNILMRKFAMSEDRLLGYHSRYGLCLLQLNEDHSEVVSSTYFNEIGDAPVDPAVGMFATDENIFIKWRDTLYITAESGLRAIENLELHDMELQQNLKKYDLLNDADESFALANMDHNSLRSKDAFIFSRDYGYSYEPLRPAPKALSVEIAHVEIRGHKGLPVDLNDLSPGQQNIIIQLRKSGDLTISHNLQYILEPSDDTWRSVPASGALSFQNLASENYALHIKDGYGNRKELVSFEAPAPWHLSWPGGILYTSIVIGIALAWNTRVRRRTAEKARLRHMDEVRRLEAERIRHNNEQLQREVQLKSKLLANRAMALAQKNKLLLQLKDLAKSRPASESESSVMRSRIIRMVDQNTDREDEWKVFENNFDEVHEKFTERLLEKHPNLTAGDKRLASFIRMDLSSKEIAPLLRISVRSVENKRHRLRKKMRLESGQRLNEYLMRF